MIRDVSIDVRPTLMSKAGEMFFNRVSQMVFERVVLNSRYALQIKVRIRFDQKL